MVRVLACLLAAALLGGGTSANDKKPKDEHKAKKTKKSTDKKRTTDRHKDPNHTGQGRPNISPANAAKIKQLREEIGHLRHHEHRVLQNIDARYKHVLTKLDAPEDQLERERNRLRRDERVALANIPPGTEHDLVRQQYHELIRLLNNNIRHDEHRMDRIRRIRDSEKQHVRAAFGSKIHALEHELHQLERSGGGKR